MEILGAQTKEATRRLQLAESATARPATGTLSNNETHRIEVEQKAIPQGVHADDTFAGARYPYAAETSTETCDRRRFSTGLPPECRSLPANVVSESSTNLRNAIFSFRSELTLPGG